MSETGLRIAWVRISYLRSYATCSCVVVVQSFTSPTKQGGKVKPTAQDTLPVMELQCDYIFAGANIEGETTIDTRLPTKVYVYECVLLAGSVSKAFQSFQISDNTRQQRSNQHDTTHMIQLSLIWLQLRDNMLSYVLAALLPLPCVAAGFDCDFQSGRWGRHINNLIDELCFEYSIERQQQEASIVSVIGYLWLIQLQQNQPKL